MKALVIIRSVENELRCGTKHFRQSTGKELKSVEEILLAMKDHDLLIEFHCISCGSVINFVAPIDERLCEKCKLRGGNES